MSDLPLASRAEVLAAPERLWVCTDHDSHYPVGCASIVMARDETQAREFLDQALRESGLNPSQPYTLIEINMSLPFARVLMDGNY